MKTPKIFAAIALGVATFACTSCQDWLTLYPQDKLTDEQFWEDMNDLEAVRYAAYRNFASGDVVKKILTWGELRSDNVVFANISNVNDYGAMLRITDGRLDTASAFNDWATFYTTINYCNQVLHNGERVLQRDPQFSATQWRRIKAEMISLRALNYFYLVRAFGNVPYVNTVIKTDAEVKTHKQSLQSDILDSLINDVDLIKEDVRLYYTSNDETRSLITKPFPYALLSDLCLWRGAKFEGQGNKDAADSLYWRAYEYAKEGLRIMDDPSDGQYKAIYNRDTRSKGHMGAYYLLQNFTQSSSSEIPSMEAFEKLFGEDGASDEVIFEMPFNNTTDKVGNGVFKSYFGLVTNSSAVTFYSNYQGLRLCCPKSNDADKFYDLRLVYTCAYADANNFTDLTEKNITPHGNGYVMKFQQLKNSHSFFNIVDATPKYSLTFEASDYHNLIIYRKSDLLFQMAEAVALVKKLNVKHATEATSLIPDAQNIIAEHRRRSYYQYREYTGSLTADYLTSSDARWTKANVSGDSLLAAVLDEKQIEFVGEGKRWFDIVRYMERSGAKSDAISKMFSSGRQAYSMYKHDDHAQRYKSNLRARWAFYNPVYYPEREASGWKLYQNPYWDDDPTNNDPESGEPEGAIDKKEDPQPEQPNDNTPTESTDDKQPEQSDGGNE